MRIFDSLKSNVERLKAATTVSGLRKGLEAERLIEALKDEVSYIRREAAEALGKIGEPAVAPLIQALNDEDPNVRGSAIGILGVIGGERAIEALIQALEDGEPDVRESAARALGNTGDELAVEPHTRALRERESAIEPLIRALEDREPKVRGSAARALGNIGDERAVESLNQASKDGDSFVQRSAAEALSRIGPKPLPLINPILDNGVREAAIDFQTFAAKFSMNALKWLRQESDKHIENDFAQLLDQPVICKFCKAVVRPVDGAGKSGKTMLFKCSRCHNVWCTIEEGRIDWQ